MILIVVFEFNRVAPWSIPDTQAQVIGGALVGTAVFPAVYNLLSQPDVAKQLVDVGVVHEVLARPSIHLQSIV